MQLDYTYSITESIKNHLYQLDVLKKALTLMPPLPHIEENLRRKSLLKSSVYSARIEGNRLRMEDVENSAFGLRSETKEKMEIANILKAIHWLDSEKTPAVLSAVLLKNLHGYIMSGLTEELGKFRQGQSAIFNQAGVAIYMPPPAGELEASVDRLINRVNLSKDSGPLKSAYFHFVFEKIHPFLDGNGRVGRLVSAFILKQTGYDFRSLVSLEEYLENERDRYYYFLNISSQDITPFVEFFVEGLLIQAEKAVGNLGKTEKERPEDSLLPRRREILEIIRDQKMVSFDAIKRRFYKVPVSSIHYDLKQLIKHGFIKKLGITRGSLYTPATI